jgi:hypothetical protein
MLHEFNIGSHIWFADVNFVKTPLQPPKLRNGEVLDAGCPAEVTITDISVKLVQKFRGGNVADTVMPNMRSSAELGKFLMRHVSLSHIEEEILSES